MDGARGLFALVSALGGGLLSKWANQPFTSAEITIIFLLSYITFCLIEIIGKLNDTK